MDTYIQLYSCTILPALKLLVGRYHTFFAVALRYVGQAFCHRTRMVEWLGSCVSKSYLANLLLP